MYPPSDLLQASRQVPLEPVRGRFSATAITDHRRCLSKVAPARTISGAKTYQYQCQDRPNDE